MAIVLEPPAPAPAPGDEVADEPDSGMFVEGDDDDVVGRQARIGLEQGRVAIGDAIGAVLPAKISVVLIGERPGLSSPDSLGVYITWAPSRGRTDAERNCISNVRPEGLEYAVAARMLGFYLHEALRQKLTGVALKLAGDFHGRMVPEQLP